MEDVNLGGLGGQFDRVAAQSCVNAGQFCEHGILVLHPVKVEQGHLAQFLGDAHLALENTIAVGFYQILRPNPNVDLQASLQKEGPPVFQRL